MNKPLNILYAEDDPNDADLTKAGLLNAMPELVIDIARDGEECLSLINKKQYDVLLLDHCLPDMDGIEVLRALVRTELKQPVVMVTGLGDEQLVVKALRLGASDYVSKSGNYIESLPRILNRVVEEYQTNHTPGQAITLERRRVLYVEYNSMDIELTKTYFEANAPQITIDTVRSVEEAFQHLSDEEYDLVITDLRMGARSALDFMKEAKEHGIFLPFIVITASGDEETAAASLRLGAYDYVVKRDNYLKELPVSIENALARFYLHKQSGRLRTELEELNKSLEKTVVERTRELLHEINERQATEEALRYSEERFRTLVETVPQLMWISNSAGVAEYFNQRWIQYTGCSETELNDRGWNGLIHPSDRNVAREAWANSLVTGHPYEVEFRLRGANGTYRWFLARSVPLMNSSGRPLKWFGTSTDIHDQKMAQDTQKFLVSLEENTRQITSANEAINASIKYLAEYLNVQRSGYWVIDEKQDNLQIIEQYTNKVSAFPQVVPLKSIDRALLDELNTGKPHISNPGNKRNRTESEPASIHNLDDHETIVIIPILNNHKLTAGVYVNHLEAREWSTHEIIMMQAVAERIWVAQENIRLNNETIQNALRQREFLHDILLSVTDGKLRLCSSYEDLPARKTSFAESIDISASSALATVRYEAANAAKIANYEDDRKFDLITAASEASMNAVVHGGGGYVNIYMSDPLDTIQIWIEDKGQGISMEHIPLATLSRGYTTAGSMGHGFKMMLETADRIWLLTGPEGTTIVIEQDKVRPPLFWMRTNELSVQM